jgi:Rhodopirellula transposase DDE domain
LSLVGPQTGGDPRGETKFVRSRLQTLGTGLGTLGFSACPTTVARLLRGQADSPRINAQRFTGPDHPDRDRQFVTIREWVAIVKEWGLPILSVDGTKKELIGTFKNPGAVWCAEPEEVNVDDVLSDAECRAVPYGIDDLVSGRGPIGVGISSETAAFAVEAIASWWARSGGTRYRGADELWILAAGGGSHGHRPRLGTARLQERIADRYASTGRASRSGAGRSCWGGSGGPKSVAWG